MGEENTGALPNGSKVLWYETTAVLGKGGFGVTYLARDTNLDQLVAMKEYLPVGISVRERDGVRVRPVAPSKRESYEWGLNRFVQEAQILARFKDSSIVRVLSFFRENETAYIVMEYEEGESLGAILQRRRVMPQDELAPVLGSLLDGLETLHQASFIHRDIKPGNIYIRKDGSPVLLDFGSARQALAGQNQEMTSLLSLGYSPFEQYDSSGARQGPWSDIYSLGGVLYRAVTGNKPMDAALRISAKLRSDPDPMKPASEIAGSRYSPHFLAAIDAALQVLEHERPQDIRSWREMFNPPEVEKPVPELARRDEVAERREAAARKQAPGQGGLTGLFGLKKKSAWRSFVSSLDNFTGAPRTSTREREAAAQERAPAPEPMTSSQGPPPSQAAQVEEPFLLRDDEEEPGFDIQIADRPPALKDRRPGQLWVERLTGVEFVWIPGGTFLMGSSPGERGRREDEGPVHEVEVDGFWMGKVPVTWGQWKLVMGAPKRDYTRERDEYPIEKVLWEDTQRFIRKLSRMGGEKSAVRLPTEAEWEYAARCGTTTAFHFGDNPEKLGDYAWYAKNGNQQTHPVGKKLPNDWGLYDIIGNVWEWTNDWYGEDYYSFSPFKNPRGATGGVIRVRRGGSWRSNMYACRCAHRNRVAAYAQSNALGFRLVKEDEPGME